MFLAQLKQDVAAYQQPPRRETLQPARDPSATTKPPPKRSFIARHSLPEPGTLPPELQAPIRHLAQRNPWWLFPALTAFEFLGVVIYLVQLPITYALVRLEYEQRWYIVTDRSLRIRSGLVSLRESTMSFANLQQVTVTQGPLQRVLGIADVQVRSAGGGSGESHEKGQADDSMHVGIFHGVENAIEIRDLILERLRQYRAAGLGDPDDSRESGSHPVPANVRHTVAAARELLAEAQALRDVCQPRLGPTD
jgi:membrane protein YdbS with pleckstrin-like domain